MSDLPSILGGIPVRTAGQMEWPRKDPEIEEVFQKLFQDGSWCKYHGEYASRLEAALNNYFHRDFVSLCSSGTSAVELALRGLDIKNGDEIILSAYDFKANMTNILLAGAIPVLVDVVPGSWVLNLQNIHEAVSHKTRAVIISHLHGELVDFSGMMEFFHERCIAVIEDICQVPGAKQNGQVVGSQADLAVLSFGGSKLLTSGRGGAVLTNSHQMHQRIQLYQQRGNIAYPLSEMQAAVLIPQFEKLDQLNRQRMSFVSRLIKLINEFPGLKTFDLNEQSSYYKLGMIYNRNEWDSLSREDWINAMRAEGMGVDFPFRSLHLIHSKKRFRQIRELENARLVDGELIVWHHPVFLGGTLELMEIHQSLQKIRNHLPLLLNSLKQM